VRRAALDGPRVITGWNFDWDDNIFFMPTKIMLRNTVTGEEHGVSTRQFALIREKVGHPGAYQEFELADDAFRFFGDTNGANHFGQDVTAAVKGGGRWQGPSWKAFVRAMSDEATAARTTIITARMHAPETIHAGLCTLQALGLIDNVPPLENMYPVNYPPLAEALGGSDAASPSAAKTVVMEQILDELSATPVAEGTPAVLDAAGEGRRPMHLWGFSDDDYGNHSEAVKALSEDVAAGRWPNVKIVVFFTGTNHPNETPRAEVLTPDGGTRPMTASELEHSQRSWVDG